MRSFLHLALILATGSVVWAQPPAVPPAVAPAAVDHGPATKLLIEREAKKQKLVGVSVAVGREGKVVFQHHVGFEDREGRVAASGETMYRWASISKPVTAVAAMQLVEANKLDLDADVRTLVPEFPVKDYTPPPPPPPAPGAPVPIQDPAPSVPCVITLRQLLCHQGGVVHYSNGKVVVLPVPKDVEHPYQDVLKALDTFKESPLVCEPGTKYSYTTHGYMLLGAAVQRAAGKSYWSVVREWIAMPAGMNSFRPDYQWEKIEHRAVGYRKSSNGEMVRSTDTDVSWKLPGGGFISNVGDLSRFSIALMEGQLVQPETFTKMRTAQKLKSGEATGYGLGLSVGTLAGKPTAAHSGSQEKAATYLLMLPEQRLSVAVMSNTEGASLGKLAEAVAKEWLEGGKK